MIGAAGAALGWSTLVFAADPPTTLPDLCHAKSASEVSALIIHPLSCGFDRAQMSYAGSPVQQARCLLRIIPNGGRLSPDGRPLPPALEAKIGAGISVSRDDLRRYLASKGITADEIGGDINAGLAKTATGHSATYFVIHDTSTPNYLIKPFPAEIDVPSWAYNELAGWKLGQKSSAHVFIARSGVSVTPLDYSTPWRATKTESCVLGETSRGLFIHTELVQPRRSDSHRPPGNDALAPSAPLLPFGQAQLDRLALVYIAASVRAGHWMIPASHAAIDDGLSDGHDDPRAFPIAAWSASIDKLLAEISVR
jgi:hypothetical protein